MALQTDGWNCGPWTVMVARAFAAYMDSSSFGQGVFASFLVAWLKEAGGVEDLRNADEGSSSINQRFIDEERVRMRTLLFEAAVDGKLAYTEGSRLDVFVEGKSKVITEAELARLDGE